MRRDLKVALAAILGAICLSGCATKMDAADASRIKSITITTATEPDYYYGPTSAYGVSRDFNTPMKSQGLRLGSELADAIARKLQAEGYQTGKAPADAAMDILVSGLLPTQQGPYYAMQSEGLEPMVTAKVRLVDSASGKTLFNQIYEFADPPIKPMDGTVLMTPDKKYAFKSEDDLLAHPAMAAEGFRSMLEPIASAVAASLKKPN